MGFGGSYNRDISIHALVKRATLHLCYLYLFHVISIHALVKRATVSRIHRNNPKRNFNPRPREEGDAVKVGDTIKINDFNPRPREEGDCI